jgi:hypothetical protein
MVVVTIALPSCTALSIGVMEHVAVVLLAGMNIDDQHVVVYLPLAGGGARFTVRPPAGAGVLEEIVIVDVFPQFSATVVGEAAIVIVGVTVEAGGMFAQLLSLAVELPMIFAVLNAPLFGVLPTQLRSELGTDELVVKVIMIV